MVISRLVKLMNDYGKDGSNKILDAIFEEIRLLKCPIVVEEVQERGDVFTGEAAHEWAVHTIGCGSCDEFWLASFGKKNDASGFALSEFGNDCDITVQPMEEDHE